MISKLTDTHESMRVYLLHVSATYVTNFREKHYKGYIEILQKFKTLHIYKILN